jgi:hypothetical protein
MFDDRAAGADASGPLTAALDSVSAALVGASGAVAGRGVRELLDAVGVCEVLTTRVQLLAARVLAELPVDDRVTENRLLPDAPVRRGKVSPHEVALILGVRVSTAWDRFEVARTVTRRLPTVAGVAAQGELKWWQVRRTAEAVARLDPAAAATVDTRVAGAAQAGRCRSRFSPILDRAVMAAAPELAEQHREEGLSQRGIWFRPADSGMTAFGGLLPAEGAVSLAACLTRLAGTPIAVPPVSCDPTGRTLDQARADGLVGLADHLLDQLLDPPGPKDTSSATDMAGRPDPGGSAARTSKRAQRRAVWRAHQQQTRLTDTLTRMIHSGLLTEAALAADAPSRLDGPAGTGNTATGKRGDGRRGRVTGEVRLTVSAETLLGTSQAPGDLDGYGPITAAHARQLAHRAGMTWRRLLTDPTSGTILDVGRTRYRPPDALADLVTARYSGRCTRPGCSHRGSDLDHALAWNAGGTTTDRNLHPVCRGCHTAKHAGMTVTLHDDGTVTWTAPHGHSQTTPPTDHRPEDHYADAHGPGSVNGRFTDSSTPDSDFEPPPF